MTIKLTPKEDGQEVLPFEQWARAKYNEISKLVNPCDANGNLDPQRLNLILTQFSQSFAWAITILEIETNTLNIATHTYDAWYKECYNWAIRALREEAGGAGRLPGQVTVDARIVQVHGVELIKRQSELERQRSRVDLLRGFVKVLDRQANILQTLSSNMRSELFFAAGVPMNGRLSTQGKVDASKALLHDAMKKDRNQPEPTEPVEDKG